MVYFGQEVGEPRRREGFSGDDGRSSILITGVFPTQNGLIMANLMAGSLSADKKLGVFSNC